MERDQLARPAAGAEETAAIRRPILELTDVAKSFTSGPLWHRRRVPVLRGVTLAVRSGELVGLAGENGAGKSTVMQIVVGLIGSDSGRVEHSGRLGYCPSNPCCGTS